MGRTPANKIPRKTLEEFIELVGSGVGKTKAAEALGFSRFALQRAIGREPELKEALDRAWYDGAEPIIEELTRRGVEGWDEPVYQKGELVGFTHKFDTVAAIFAVKGRRPEYKENPRIDISSVVGVKFEDRSAQVAEMWRVLADAGVDAKAIAAGLGGQPSRAELPVVAGVVAEPSDV